MDSNELNESILEWIKDELGPRYPQVEFRIAGYRDQLCLFDNAGGYLLRIKPTADHLKVTPTFGVAPEVLVPYEIPNFMERIEVEVEKTVKVILAVRKEYSPVR